MTLENIITLLDVAAEKAMGKKSANTPYPTKKKKEKLLTVRERIFQLLATFVDTFARHFALSPQLQKSVCNTNPRVMTYGSSNSQNPQNALQKLKSFAVRKTNPPISILPPTETQLQHYSIVHTPLN